MPHKTDDLVLGPVVSQISGGFVTMVDAKDKNDQFKIPCCRDDLNMHLPQRCVDKVKDLAGVCLADGIPYL